MSKQGDRDLRAEYAHYWKRRAEQFMKTSKGHALPKRFTPERDQFSYCMNRMRSIEDGQ